MASDVGAARNRDLSGEYRTATVTHRAGSSFSTLLTPESPAWLWTPTTAARNRSDPWVIEIVAGRNLRDAFGLTNGSIVEVQLTDGPHAGA
ncbi:MAG TPA: hypothetical protein VJO33_20205 [Gemmatimonadaceae bacterium]|nr:hypothetical protein [Gemmatimonadaceae bacterium]